MEGRDAARPRRGARAGALIQPRIREVALRGRTYRYAEIGAGPPLLLLHGWNGSWENFRSWFETLAPSFRLVVPDLPGCAGAPRLVGRHTAADQAEWAHELIDALAIRPAVVGGLCSGATVAMSLDARHPEDVAALLLHTPLYRDVLHRSILLQLRLYALPFAGPLVDRLRRDARVTTLYRRIFTNGAEVASEDDVLNQRDLERADLGAGRELLLDVLRADHRPALRDTRRPLFVILATADAFLRADAARRLEALAPHARVAVVEGGGHGWTAAYLARQSELLADFARSQRP